MSTAIRIDPDALYDDDLLSDWLGIHPRALLRARRSGELRFTRRGNRTLYLGKWVLDWLTKEEAASA